MVTFVSFMTVVEMRKVTKILLKALSVTLLFLIFSPIVLTLVIDLPSVQNFIVDRATAIISNKLGTTVSIDKIRLGVLGSLRVEGFYVEDFQQDTLLYVKKLKVYLSSFEGEKGITLRNGSIDGSKLYLRETPNGVMYVKEVVNSFAKRDSLRQKGDFALRVKDVKVDDLMLIIEQDEHRDPSYGIDYGDLHLEHTSAYVEDFELLRGQVKGRVRNFSTREHSGFTIQNFTGYFLVDKGVVDLRDFEIMAEKSDVRLRSLVLKGDSWASYKDFIHNVNISGEVYDSSVSSDDVAHFAPKILPWNLILYGANISVEGTVDNLNVDIHELEFGHNSQLSGNVHLRGLPEVKSSTMEVDLTRLDSDEMDLSMLFKGITGRELPDRVLSMANAAGRIIATGRFNGGFAACNADMLLTTDIGNVELSAERAPLKREKGEAAASSLKAVADLRYVNLGELLHNDILGPMTAYVSFDGATSKQGVSGDFAARVGDVEFYGANYENIEVAGSLNRKSVSVEVDSETAPLKMSLNGTADFNNAQPVYDFRLNVREADLAAMRVNRRDSISTVTFDAELYAVGRTFDDINGSLSIDGGRYYYNADTLSTGAVRMVARSGEGQRSLNLTSDFADATFTGPTSYSDVARYLNVAMRKYLPGLSDADQYVSSDEGGYSALSVKVKKIDPLLDAISSGLRMAEGTSINFMMNPVSNLLSLRAESQYVERRNMLATNINVNLTNQGDSLAMYLQSEDLYAGAFHLPQLSVMGGAKNDRVVMSAGFSNAETLSSGVIGLRANLVQDSVTSQRRVALYIQPSTLHNRQREWRISSGPVMLDTTRIVVNDFRISSGRQSLHLDGVASRSREDSLTLVMQEFDLAPFMGFAKRMNYTVTGRGSGVASMKSALSGGELMADIDIDSMYVNEFAVAPLCLLSEWDVGQQRVRVRVKNNRTGDNVVTGYYDPQSVRYYAEGTFEKMPMASLDPLLKGVVSSTEGEASAKLEILGQRRQAKLNGTVNVADLATTVDFTQARYSVPRATLQVKDNHFIANNVRVYDKERNSGMFNMDLSLEHLSNIAYSMRVVPRNMIVLDTDISDNDLFYGKVYGSGIATITGNKRGTTLDIVGSTEGNSQFFMPLSSKSDAANADFVVFEQEGARDVSDTTNYLSRRKMAFERRNRQRASAGAGALNINVELTAKPNTEVQLVIDPTVGDIIKARGEGELNMRIVPNANIFEMYGDYTITDGSYLFTLQNIINKKFLIESGSTIQWTGDPLDARLDIDAVYKLKASLQPLLSSTTLENITRAVPVECIINLTERLTAPTVTFDIKVPNADTDIQNAVANLLNNQQSIATQFMYLLVSGSFYSDSSTSSNIGATASATTGFELLSNQLSNWLSSDDYNIILRYRPRSELTSDEIDFGFSKSLVNDRLLVELEGNYLVDNRMAASSNLSNFMGEAYITWLIDQNGNLKLKGFTQTIDRFDENQGLQETGIGIYYKEDFDNWSDLKRRIKERFMSRRKREERQRLEREAEEERLRQSDSLLRSGENAVVNRFVEIDE
ncbi:MAG: translocation/assembly module TamB domain-containing protein [Alistipes sp.]|nr:translocation/assembly module TamB domain-containing protein [Alistipes sp.]